MEPATLEALIAKGDLIGALCLAVQEAGGTMTLHGKPIDATGLRRAATESALARIENLVVANHDPGDEDMLVK